MDLEIRLARVDDLPVLLALYAQLSPGAPPTTPGEAEAALATLEASGDTRLFVAEQASGVVGTAMAVVGPGIPFGGRAWMQIENVVVDESVRSGGIGRALIDACLGFARERGCYKVQLQSAHHRQDAHRFYERYGFEPSTVGFRLRLE